MYDDDELEDRRLDRDPWWLEQDLDSEWELEWNERQEDEDTKTVDDDLTDFEEGTFSPTAD